jgi:hypothetical protein
VAVSTFGFGIHKRNPSLGVAQPRLGRSRARHHIRCRATRGGPINKLIRRASLCSDADLTLKPIFLLQRNNNAPRSFGNIGLPARPGGDQDHFRGTIPNRPRLAELLQDALAFSRISKSISTLGGIETLTLTPIRHWSPGNLKHATTREIAGQRQPIVGRYVLPTAPASTMVSNMSTSSMYCSASDNRATSYDRAATINSATIVAASSAILVVRIAVAPAAVVPAAYNCPSSNDSSTSMNGGPPVNCGASVN